MFILPSITSLFLISFYPTKFSWINLWASTSVHHLWVLIGLGRVIFWLLRIAAQLARQNWACSLATMSAFMDCMMSQIINNLSQRRRCVAVEYGHIRSPRPLVFAQALEPRTQRYCTWTLLGWIGKLNPLALSRCPYQLCRIKCLSQEAKIQSWTPGLFVPLNLTMMNWTARAVNKALMRLCMMWLMWGWLPLSRGSEN